MVVRTLEKLRSSEAFDLFWQQSLTVQKPMVLENQICLVHVRCLKSMRTAMQCVKFTMNLKPIFNNNEAIDLAINCIKDRFQQPGYTVYCQLENLLLKAATTIKNLRVN